MTLREFKFRQLRCPGLSIFVDDKEVASGFIGEVLRKIPHLADYEIVSTNMFFDMYVIRLKSPTGKLPEFNGMFKGYKPEE